MEDFPAELAGELNFPSFSGRATIFEILRLSASHGCDIGPGQEKKMVSSRASREGAYSESLGRATSCTMAC